jgi:hypothetical protein
MENTMQKTSPWIALMIAAAILPVAGGASADEPHRDKLQQRVHAANQRIDQEYRKGNFTRQEASALKLDEREVNRQSR